MSASDKPTHEVPKNPAQPQVTKPAPAPVEPKSSEPVHAPQVDGAQPLVTKPEPASVDPKDANPAPLVQGTVGQPDSKSNPINPQVQGLSIPRDVQAAEHEAQEAGGHTRLVKPIERKQLVRVRVIMPVQYEGRVYEPGAHIEVDEETARQWTTAIEGTTQFSGSRSEAEAAQTVAKHIRAQRL